MKNQTISQIALNASAILRVGTNERVIKICWIIFYATWVVFLPFFIAALCIEPSTLKWVFFVMSITIFSVASLFMAFLEYVRRVAFNHYEPLFTFQNLYESNLLEKKIIEQPMAMLNSLDKSFSKQHLEAFERKYCNVYLTRVHGNYDLLMKGRHYVFSYHRANCNDKSTADKLIVAKQLQCLQLIIATDYKQKATGLLSIGNLALKEVVSIDAWSKKPLVLENKDVAFYTLEKNDKEWAPIIAKAQKLMNTGINQLEIKIKDNTIFYTLDVPDTLLLIGLRNYFRKRFSWNKIDGEYSQSVNYIDTLLKIIQSEQL